jgi:RHS repeat-associated protein
VTDWLNERDDLRLRRCRQPDRRHLPARRDSRVHTYDSADRLLSVTNANGGGTFSSFTYTLDAVGNRTQMVDGSDTHLYDYDDLYRLTEVTYPGPEVQTYSYDPLGNRITKDDDDYTYDDADQLTDVEGVSYGYDQNRNLTSRGGDSFAWDYRNRMTESTVGGLTTTYTYNGDGVRVSRTAGAQTTTYTWDVASALPLVVQDGTLSYVYGLDLISATDASGDQVYFSYDGLGSTTEVTDDSGAVVASYRYDVFGALHSQSGSLDNQWLFAGEQYEGGAGGTGVEPLPLDDVLTATNLTDATVAHLDDDPDDPDGDWATATTVDDTELRAGFATPATEPVAGTDLQEFRVLVRKDASGGVDPTVDLELWESGGGSALATLVSGVTVSSETGQVVSGTWDAALLATADGSAVELRVVGHASTDLGDERAVEVGAVAWRSGYAVAGPELYFLRARYYDPSTGRFVSRDPVAFVQRYAYAWNNPVLYTDVDGRNPLKALKKAAEWASECLNLNPLAPSKCQEQAQEVGDAIDEVGYFDANVTGCIKVCVSLGVQSEVGSIHGYAGTGAGSYGLQAGGTWAPGQHISVGKFCYGEASYQFPVIPAVTAGPVVQVGAGGISASEGGFGGELFGELGASAGVGAPGFSTAVICGRVW